MPKVRVSELRDQELEHPEQVRVIRGQEMERPEQDRANQAEASELQVRVSGLLARDKVTQEEIQVHPDQEGVDNYKIDDIQVMDISYIYYGEVAID